MRVPRRFYAQTLVLGSVTPSPTSLTLTDGTELKVGDECLCNIRQVRRAGK